MSSTGGAVDPPWENKSVGRGSQYPMLPSRRLLGLPIGRLLHPVRASPRAYERASAGPLSWLACDSLGAQLGIHCDGSTCKTPPTRRRLGC